MATKKRRKRQLNTILAGVVATAAAVGAGWWWWTGPHAEAEARQRAANALARFERCYVGEAGLGPDDTKSRVRRIALAAGLAHDEEQSWPSGCEDALTQLRDALDASGDDESVEAFRHLSAISRLMSFEELSAPRDDVYLELGAWVEAARAAALPNAEPPSDDAPVAEVPPPEPVEPVEADAIETVAEGGRLEIDRASGAPTILLRATSDPPTVIACAARDEEEDLRCGAAIEDRVLRPLARAPGAPVIFTSLAADEGATELLSGADGSSMGPRVRPGLATADGSIRGLRFPAADGQPFLAVRRGPGEPEQTTALEIPFAGAIPSDALFADGVVAIRWDDPGKHTAVLLHTIGEDGTLGPPRTIETSAPLAQLCPIESGAALVTRTNEDAWAVHVSTESGARSHPLELEGEPAVWCVPDAVSFLTTAPEADGVVRIHVTRCGASGCAETTGTARAPLAGSTRAHALDLGDKVLVLFEGDDAPSTALVATLDGLDDATPRVVTDVATFGGIAIADPTLIPHRRGALVMFRAGEAWRALAIDPTGLPRPARVLRAGEP